MSDSTFAEHVATTNSRLASLRANLVDPGTFPEAASELTKWCQDQRAFTAHFEDNLMAALETAMDYGTRENYDYMLTHGLVGACFTHRKHLSKNSATRIGRWYEQMRRLKKNGGKRKRAPPKPKEQPVVVPTGGALPGLTSPCPPQSNVPPLVPLQQQNLVGQQQMATENNNFMFSPTDSDGSMWAPSGVPMSTPGSSAGHMGGPGAAAPYPGPMNPGQQAAAVAAGGPHPGMNPGAAGPYSAGQMQLPYGQMEGNHAMYDHRMMANRAAAAAAAAGRPPGMMPDYTQMPMGQHPGNPMMRMPVQYPPGQPQMPGHPQMQYGQMMRAPPVSVYGQMTHAQQYAVTAHPNPVQQTFILPEVRQLYEAGVGLHVERELLSEGLIPFGSTGVEAPVNPEAFAYLENPHSDILISVWQSTKGAETGVQFQVYVNHQLILTNEHPTRVVSIKNHLRVGLNLVQFGYSGPQQMHSYTCEFVSKRSIHQMRGALIQKRAAESGNIGNQQRQAYAQMANKRQAGVVPLSLNCALSKKRMFMAARHHDCKKFTFDFAQLIHANKDKTRYLCPSCLQHFKFDDINIDYFLTGCLSSIGGGINEILLDKIGNVRMGDVEETKPKRGKKKNDAAAAAAAASMDGGAHTIKRIKSETLVKQEPGMFPDMHGRNVPFSPMTMPGSVPPDWTRLQSPSFSMQSPNKIQLGPATPATPGMVFQNPASAGSMLNMSSPRGPSMMPGVPGGPSHPMMPPHDPSMNMRSGSAPYTPESVKMDKNDELLMNIEGLFISNTPFIFNSQDLIQKYMDGTKDCVFDDGLIYDYAASPKQAQPSAPDASQTLMAPGSTSSSNASTFTPPFDDIHLGNRPSH